MKKYTASLGHSSLQCPFMLLVAGLFITAGAVTLKLANDHECDRYSLDALYHEKYERITEDILADSTEFVNRVSDLLSNSMIEVMADLPDRDSSDMEEKKIFVAFNELKRKFVKSVNNIKKNITKTWESLLVVNHDLMIDYKNFTLDDLRNKTLDVTEMYVTSRRSLDASMEAVVSPIKNIVSNGLEGINAIAASEIRKEKKKEKEEKEREEKEKNEEKEEDQEREKRDEEKERDPGKEKEDEEKKKSEKEKKDGEKERKDGEKERKDGENERKDGEKERKDGEKEKKDGEKEEKSEDKEEGERAKEEKLDKKEIYEKMKETVKTLIPGFLGKASSVVLERKVSLKRKIETKSEDRDSVFDDLCFDLAMVRNRVSAILHKDLPRNKDGIDLARRSIYIYWAQLAEKMYKEKKEEEQGTPSRGREERYRHLWKDEEKLADTLVSLMEVYP